MERGEGDRVALTKIKRNSHRKKEADEKYKKGEKETEKGREGGEEG